MSLLDLSIEAVSSCMTWCSGKPMEWGSDHQSWEVGGSNFTLTIKHEDLILEMGNLDELSQERGIE